MSSSSEAQLSSSSSAMKWPTNISWPSSAPSPPLPTDWPPYVEDPKYPSLIKEVAGYVRERPEADCEYKHDAPFASLMEVESYTKYYQAFFYNKQHENYVSALADEEVNNLGPIIVSVENKSQVLNEGRKELRVLVHTKKGADWATLTIDEVESAGSKLKAIKKRFPQLAPIHFSKMPYNDTFLPPLLVKFEDQNISTRYKIGVLYSKEGQNLEDEMYNNEHGSAAFEEFLDFLGDRVTLQGFTGYNGGLDVKRNTTGTHSVHTIHQNCPIMFHVSTLLQYYPADPQQVERKRHLGNDVIMIIFREGKNEPFDPLCIHSQFNHVFIVVSPKKSKNKDRTGTYYRVDIACQDGVIPFLPRLPDPPIFRKGPKFREWLLSKLINAERAAFHAPKFVIKIRNTRKMQLKDVIEECQDVIPGKSKVKWQTLSRKTGETIGGVGKKTTKMFSSGNMILKPKGNASSKHEFSAELVVEQSEPVPVVIELKSDGIVCYNTIRNNGNNEKGELRERYTLFQIRRWSSEKTVFHLDFGEYRAAGYMHLISNKAEQMNEILTAFIQNLDGGEQNEQSHKKKDIVISGPDFSSFRKMTDVEEMAAAAEKAGLNISDVITSSYNGSEEEVPPAPAPPLPPINGASSATFSPSQSRKTKSFRGARPAPYSKLELPPVPAKSLPPVPPSISDPSICASNSQTAIGPPPLPVRRSVSFGSMEDHQQDDASVSSSSSQPKQSQLAYSLLSPRVDAASVSSSASSSASSSTISPPVRPERPLRRPPVNLNPSLNRHVIAPRQPSSSPSPTDTNNDEAVHHNKPIPPSALTLTQLKQQGLPELPPSSSSVIVNRPSFLPEQKKKKNGSVRLKRLIGGVASSKGHSTDKSASADSTAFLQKYHTVGRTNSLGNLLDEDDEEQQQQESSSTVASMRLVGHTNASSSSPGVFVRPREHNGDSVRSTDLQRAFSTDLKKGSKKLPPLPARSATVSSGSGDSTHPLQAMFLPPTSPHQQDEDSHH